MESKSPIRNDVNLKPIFCKLGHNLEEIRVRALQNVIGKLEHNVISLNDLVQERHLITRLLEWFNFPSCPMKVEALKLILKLVKHPTAAELFLEIGALKFLSHLRADLDANLQCIVDDIHDVLLYLPEPSSSEQECVYVHPHITKDKAKVDGKVESHLDDVLRQVPLQKGFFTTTFQESKRDISTAQDSFRDASRVCGFKFATFPWLLLTETDKHVLSKTNSSLCSTSPVLINTSCEFICDVVLQDFPAEIFLQRTALVKSIFSLVSIKPPETDSLNIAIGAMNCLTDLCCLLQERYKFYHDPTLYCPQQNSGSPFSSGVVEQSSTSHSILSSDSRPSVVGQERRHQGDGQDGESSTSAPSSVFAANVSMISGSEVEADLADALLLQMNQLTLPQFVIDTIAHVVPHLECRDSKLLIVVMDLLHECLQLVEISMTSRIWDDESVIGKSMVERITEVLDSLGESLVGHHSALSVTNDQEVVTQHRLVFLGSALFMINFITKLVPLEKMPDVMPESIIRIITLLNFDPIFKTTFSFVNDELASLLEKIDSEKLRTLQRTKNVCYSFEAYHSLFAEVGNKDTTIDTLVMYAKDAILGLSCHGCLWMVRKTIQLLSLFALHNYSESNETDQIVVDLLSIPVENVRKHAYDEILIICKESLNIEKASHGNIDSSKAIKFLVSPNILQEICNNGLNNINTAEAASNIMLHLLQGQLLMTSGLWKMLKDALIPCLPFLQAVASKHTPLGRCVIDLFTDLGPDGIVPKLEQFRGVLRMMLSKHSSVRSECMKAVLWHLTLETDAEYKLPSFLDNPLGDFSSLFVLEKPVSLDDQTPQFIFQVDRLLQVFNIFATSATELKLRKSALEQVSILLQDVTLHGAFLSNGGVEHIMEIMHQALSTKTSISDQIELQNMIEPCLVCLKHLLHKQANLRHRLAHQIDVYCTVLRCTLLKRYVDQVQVCSAYVLAFLLFDEIASLSSPESESSTSHFSLPKTVKERYQLPFICTMSIGDESVDRFREARQLLDDIDAAAMLKISWHVARAGSLEELAAKLNRKDKDTSKFSPELVMNETDNTVFLTTYTQAFLAHCLGRIRSAQSHHSVRQALRNVTQAVQVFNLKPNINIRPYIGYDIEPLMMELTETIGRFLLVIPASPEDELLLGEVLQLLRSLIMSTNEISQKMRIWLGDAIGQGETALVNLLQKRSAGPRGDQEHSDKVVAERYLHKQLWLLIHSFVQKLPMSSEAWRHKSSYIGGDIVNGLLASLTLADARHFYDLPSLERTLSCIVHITARPDWSKDCSETDALTLCQQLLNVLLEVISAFHVGRGGTAMSYMGKGVTKSATLCLRHLVAEVAHHTHMKDWAKEWLFPKPTSTETEEAGFAWVVSLWSYRDPEVRAAGLGIASGLASSPSGCLTIANGCHQLPGGLWAMVFDKLLDHSECSLVRQQAANLLCNLLSHDLPDRIDEVVNAAVWQGPCVQDEDTQALLLGKPALLALLQHYNFYGEVSSTLENYYGSGSIQPVTLLDDSTLPTHSNITTSGTVVSSLTSSHNTISVSGNHDNNAMSGLERPAIPGQQGSSSSSTVASSYNSSISMISKGSEVSVVTPELVTGLCRVLHNLVSVVPSDTNTSLTNNSTTEIMLRLIDVKLLDGYLKDLTASKIYSTRILQHHLVMVAQILDLILCQIINDHDNIKKLVGFNLLPKCCGLLALNVAAILDSPLHDLLMRVWQCVFAIFSTMIRLNAAYSTEQLQNVLSKCWPRTTDCIVHVLKVPTYSATRIASLHFLAHLFSYEGQDNSVETNADLTKAIIDLLDESVQYNGDSIASGSTLCEVILQGYDGTLPKSLGSSQQEENMAIYQALKTLLAVCNTAKDTAMKAGLLDSLVSNMKFIQEKLKIEALKMAKHSKKKDDPLISELISAFNLLQNFMFASTEIKMAGYLVGLSGLIQSLWSWCLLEQPLLLCVLNFMSTYTAKCPTVCISMASTPAGHSGISLLHSLIKLADRERVKTISNKGEDTEVQQQLFNVLGNLMWSAECRSILWKSNFLQGFIEVTPAKRGKDMQSKVLNSQRWLHLLTNLSFSTEGQIMIMRITGSLELLLEYAMLPNTGVSQPALMIIRNLCFNTTNKPKLLASDKVVKFLMSQLHADSLNSRHIASTALWSLATNSQKAKVALKNSGLAQQVLQAEAKLKVEQASPYNQEVTLFMQYQQALKNILNIVME
ncbi:rotatin-like isoform X2 [Antedon mediterranea]|uniref:rotatin-like isoform X2 n=1 Tax=Antedon mediterranea TaxID=105859 RepID=UPI003AF8D920